MIVASFFAPRYEKWPGCDYDALLRLLDASCKRFGLDHWVISDSNRPGDLQTFRCKLPENLMQAFLDGQMQFLSYAQEPVLLVGADCLITRDPRPLLLGDITCTTSSTFSDCEMNSGAIWCMPSQSHVWRNALARNPVEWGQDQTCLYAAMQESCVDLATVRAEDHNWAPETVEDNAGMPTVVHFRGRRKSWMAEWARRHMGLVA